MQRPRCQLKRVIDDIIKEHLVDVRIYRPKRQIQRGSRDMSLRAGVENVLYEGSCH